MKRYDPIWVKQINRPGLVCSRNFKMYVWEFLSENNVVCTLDNPDTGRRYSVKLTDVLEVRDQLTNELLFVPDRQVVQ